jgi:hypothetical protein
MPDTTTTRPLDAERERLRAKGYDDDFIREYLLRQEMQEQAQAQQSGAPTGAGGVAPQGMYSTVVGSCLAVFGYIKDSLAAIPDHYKTMRDAQATAKAKRDAGAALIVKLALTGLLIFGAGREFIKLTIYEVEIAKQQALKAAEDTEIAKNQKGITRGESEANTALFLNPFASENPSPVAETKAAPATVGAETEGAKCLRLMRERMKEWGWIFESETPDTNEDEMACLVREKQRGQGQAH